MVDFSVIAGNLYKICADEILRPMCQILNEVASSLKLMEGLPEDIMQERRQCTRFCMKGYSVLCCIKIIKHIVGHAMHVNE